MAATTPSRLNMALRLAAFSSGVRGFTGTGAGAGLVTVAAGAGIDVETAGFVVGTEAGFCWGAGLGVEGMSILRKWFMTEDHAHTKNGGEEGTSDEE